MAQVHGEDSVSPPELLKPEETVVFFFRSEDQIQGYPLPSSEVALEGGGTALRPTPDNTYPGNFGFDIYRPALYGGESTDQVEPLILNNYRSTIMCPGSIKSFKNNKVYDITDKFEYKQRRGDNRSPYFSKYYMPNIFIPKSTEITIYARAFVTDEMKAEQDFKLIFELTCNNSVTIEEVIEPIKVKKDNATYRIKLRANDIAIESPITLTATAEMNVKDASGVIDRISIDAGMCRIIEDNKEYSPNVVLVNVGYNLEPTDNLLFTKEDLNTKGFNQACINLNFATNKKLKIEPTDFIPKAFTVHNTDEDKAELLVNITAEPYTLHGGANIITTLDRLLGLCTFKFFEKYALLLMDKLQAGYRNINLSFPIFEKSLVNGEYVRTETEDKLRLLKDEQTIKSVLGDDDYLEVIDQFIRFMRYNRFTSSPVFLLQNIDGPMSLGYISAKGVVLTRNMQDNAMVVIHEIGHNLGLRHTFITEPENNKLEGVKTEIKTQIEETQASVKKTIEEAEMAHCSLGGINKPLIRSIYDEIFEAIKKLKIADSDLETAKNGLGTARSGDRDETLPLVTKARENISEGRSCIHRTTGTIQTVIDELTRDEIPSRKFIVSELHFANTSESLISDTLKEANKALRLVNQVKSKIDDADLIVHDLKRPQGGTLENIMDYIIGNNSKSFVTFQWRKMREIAGQYVNIIDALNFNFNESNVYIDHNDNYLDGNNKYYLTRFSECLIKKFITKRKTAAGIDDSTKEVVVDYARIQDILTTNIKNVLAEINL